MKAREVGAADQTTWVIVFDKDDDPVAGLTAFARANSLSASHFTGVGAFSRVVVGYFDRERKEYARIEIDEQVEVLSLDGDVAVGEDGESAVHAHVVVGKADGSAHGGHLLEGRVWPTLEVVVVESPATLRKRMDPETGLALIALEESEG